MDIERRRLFSVAERPVAIVKDGRVFDLSPELLARGVAVGTKEANLLELWPGVLAIRYEPERYEDVWEETLDLYARHVPAVEPVGMGPPASPTGRPVMQAFLDARGIEPAVFGRIGDDGAKRLGLRIYFGLGPTKLLARAAGLDLAGQPCPGSGQASLIGKDADLIPVSRLYPFELEVINRLERLGFRRMGDLRRIPAPELARQFGWPLARRLETAAAGGDDAPVHKGWPPPAIAASRHFEGGLVSRTGLDETLAELAASLSRELSGKGLAAGEVHLALTGERCRREEAFRRLSRPVRAKAALRATLDELTRRLLAAWAEGPGSQGDPPAGLEVRLGRIRPWAGQQMDFGYARGFGMASRARDEAGEVTLALARRFGGKVIRGGAFVPPEKSRRETVLSFFDPMRAQGHV